MFAGRSQGASPQISMMVSSILLAWPALTWLAITGLTDPSIELGVTLYGALQALMVSVAAVATMRVVVAPCLWFRRCRHPQRRQMVLGILFASILALSAAADLSGWLLLAMAAAVFAFFYLTRGRRTERDLVLFGLVLLIACGLFFVVAERVADPYLQLGGDSLALAGLLFLLRLLGREDAATGSSFVSKVEGLKHLIDVVPVGVVVMETDSRIRYTNRQFASMMGSTDRLEAVERLSDLAPDVVSREVLLNVLANLTESVDLESTGTTAISLRRLDGVDVTAEIAFGCARVGDRAAVIAIVRDTLELSQQDYLLHMMATTDDLTGLPNRMQLSLILDDPSSGVARGVPGALVLIDLDRFRQVNETLGHEFGDLLLVTVCARLIEILPADTPLVRFSGDVLVAVLLGADRGAVVASADRILRAFAEPILINEWEHSQSLSLGIALIPSDGQDVSQLVRKADLALGWAKSSGGNAYAFYDGPVAERAQRRHRLQNLLRQALAERELHLHYQPRVDLLTRRISGWEALLRWDSPQEGAVSPGEFIPVAEKCGLILEIGDWVLQEAMSQYARWIGMGLNPGTMAVNVSPRQLRRPDFARRIAALMERYGVAADQLELEITETALMEDVPVATRVLNELSGMGVSLSVDDFGTGYSSLGYLRSFPLDRLKIDRTFVTQLGSDRHHEAIAQAIIVLAHSLGLTVVAEGVETELQLRYLVLNDCEEVQGFLFSRPLPVAECERILRDDRPLGVRGIAGI
ncbi:diguanylate cyclase/phosphodiesterase with PAS/PAC sensor(s) [Thiorhodococcus drewsii AZ1]|uniref:cyclic-guanylate-specific phosphodiesterase n=2 Tax=Thiorhodococcus drewsii TaxID=210408 RepID=G2DY37_9GAMM|nr:diguanylate cyclase/phosphodiesterase with PAS/PAC sensor(s) [Thiorhodococcus drewsii AZ1]